MYVSCVDDVSYDVLTLSISIGGYLSAAISHTCTYNSGGYTLWAWQERFASALV